VRRSIFSIGLIGAALLMGVATAAQAVPLDHPTSQQIQTVGKAYRNAQNKGGLRLVGEKILDCYHAFYRQDERLKVCILFDLAAQNFNSNMEQLFVGEGMHPAPPPTFTKEAEEARLNSYVPMVFPSFADAKDYYFGGPNAVAQVMNMVTGQ